MTQHDLIANEASAAQNAGDEGSSRQYLSFFLGGQEYATDILRVQEIKGWDTVTRVPYSPGYILGVINLRGAIVPVVDLRVRFALESAPFDSATVVIVVRVAGARGERIVGLVVDAVSDVYSFSAALVSTGPVRGSALNACAKRKALATLAFCKAGNAAGAARFSCCLQAR